MDFWNMVKKQGLSFTLIIGIAIWLGYSNHQQNIEHKSLLDKIEDCNGEKYQMLFNLAQETKLVIERNNELLKSKIEAK